MLDYRPIEESDIPQIIELYARYLTAGDTISESIRTAWYSGAYMGYIAVAEDGPVGFLTLKEGIEFTYPHPQLEAELRAFVREQKIGFCDALLILPEYRSEGTAHTLAEISRERLRKEGYSYLLAEIWIYPDGTPPAKAVFESMGDIVWQRKIDGFYRDFAAYGMRCPICGDKCVCGAWIDVIAL